MIYDIQHRITYRYDKPVLVDPLTIRLRPRSDGAQRLLRWSSHFDPMPTSSTSILDVFGNAANQVVFSGLTDVLNINTTSRVQTLRTNPFDFLALDPQIINLPAKYTHLDSLALSAYRQQDEYCREIQGWAMDVAASSGQQTQAFLSRLTEEISRDYASVVRLDGPPHIPAHTFAVGSGACRDLALLFMDACRSQGLAARFVSGYAYEPERTESPELHAWAEVYLTGGGWRGYDPSLGVAVADAHVPVAAGAASEWAAPTEGCYRGTGVSSTMDYEISIAQVTVH